MYNFIIILIRLYLYLLFLSTAWSFIFNLKMNTVKTITQTNNTTSKKNAIGITLILLLSVLPWLLLFSIEPSGCAHFRQARHTARVHVYIEITQNVIASNYENELSWFCKCIYRKSCDYTIIVHSYNLK